MARGKKCPSCGNPMDVGRQKPEPSGTWIWYDCKKPECGLTLKIFEPKH